MERSHLANHEKIGKEEKDHDNNQTQQVSDFVARLDAINQCLDEDVNLEACLEQLAAVVADSLNIGRCSLMLTANDSQTGAVKLKVCAHFGDFPKEAYNALVDLKEGICGDVLVSGKPLLVENISHSIFKDRVRFSSLDKEGGFIICPLVVSGSVLGVVNISKPKDQRVFSIEDLKLAMVIALLIAQAIQIYQLKTLFRSNFVKLAIAQEAHGKSTRDLNQIVNNNEKAIKVLAKSFYGELNKAGFSKELILGSASEIISLVTTALNQNKSDAQK